MSPTTLARKDHTISRQHINENALKVLNRLNSAGYQAFLVGGCLRDLMVGVTPKDFDIATNALPEEVRKIFRNCRLIGRRFRLAHVHFGREIIEVATFRAPPAKDTGDARCEKSGIVLRDNVFGSIEDDAWRRDFTVNALYYNIEDRSLSDYTEGLKDIEKKQIRIIGDASARYREDPVRMLRAIRLAAKLNFSIEKKTCAPIVELSHLLEGISPSRLFDEYVKLFHSGYAYDTYLLLCEYQLFDKLFPVPDQILEDSPEYESFVLNTFQNTDKRISEGKPVTPAFLLAALFWSDWNDALKDSSRQSLNKDKHHYFDVIFREQAKHVSIPRHYLNTVKDMWFLQSRLTGKIDKRAYRIISHPRFRAAYDFLVLRSESISPELSPYATWWTQFQEADKGQQEKLFQIAADELNH